MDRRRFLGYFSAAGLGATLLPGALYALAEKDGRLTKETLAEAERIAGLSFTDAERELMLRDLQDTIAGYDRLRAIPLANAAAPSLGFDPTRGGEGGALARRAPALADESADLARLYSLPPYRVADRGRARWSKVETPLPPVQLEELAFRPVTELAKLLRERKLTSLDLTRLYLARLKRCDPALHCVVTLMEERALAAARRADEEAARGDWRGPLHGVPYGIKDLFAARGARTTWGAKPYEEQTLDLDATVVRKLDEAGAVLLAKLSCGALAWGDVWFGGTTRNPWNLEQGSSGSSAGSASAVAAGLCGFAIGTETYGSIVSPSTRCGATGLRPTFGRVSRWGCMALSWSLDKVGPIARSVEDCALVFDAIRGPDGFDADVVDAPFPFDARRELKELRKLRVGYLAKAFAEQPEEEAPQAPPPDAGAAAQRAQTRPQQAEAARAAREERAREAARAREWKTLDDQVLVALRSLGIEPQPVDLPDYPVNDLMLILSAEAAAAFDDLTRSGRDDLLTRQIANAWPNVFRQARLIPAVEYVMANRIRLQAQRELARIMADWDVLVAPTYAGQTLGLLNLTGHPQVVVPSGFRGDGTPVSITFCGGLYREAPALELAKAYQDATGWHRRTPPLFGPGATPAATEAFLKGSLEG